MHETAEVLQGTCSQIDYNVHYRSLGLFLCWWTISPRGYHPPSNQCFDTDMVY